MTTNIGSIINLKYELEYKFKTKIYEQRSQAEERAKVLTSLIFTELSAFFEKMHQFNFEAELSRLDSQRSFFNSFIGTQFAFGTIKCSEMLNNLQYSQDTKLNEYYSKKEDIENKISELKNKISAREATLTGLESQISNIELTVDTADETKINLLDNHIKNIEDDLQQTQSDAAISLNEQKAVSDDIKVAAANNTTINSNPLTEQLTESVDTNITTAKAELFTDITSNTNENQNINSTDTNKTKPTIEVKRDIIKETTQNLKKAAKKQKEVLQVEKEAIASLEKTAQTLINNNITGDSKTKDLSLGNLKESLKDAFKTLEELTDSITETIRGKKKIESKLEKDIAATIDNLNSDSKTTSIEINNLIKESLKSEEELINTKSEVFLISKEMQSVDNIIENYKKLAENSNKIIVDKQLTSVYDQLTSVLGNEKVILDRREGSRRTQTDRRVFGASETQLKELKDIETKNKRVDTDRRASSDRRQLDTNTIYNIDELDYFINSKDKMKN